MPRRILILVTDLKTGGTPTVVRELAIRLHAASGVHVHVACLDFSGPTADAIRAAGIPVTPLNARGSSDLRVVGRLIALIQAERFDAVLSFLVHANVVAAIASRFRRDVRWFQSIQTTQHRPRWHWAAQALAQSAAERIIVPSPSVALAAIDRSFVPAEKITVIPNAVDADAFAALRSKPRGVRRIGFVGRLDPIKRITDLIRAISLLDVEMRLEIYGEGNERAHLESLVDQSSLVDRVRFHGSIGSPQLAMADVDLLVLPSQAEGFPLVLIEAMASGVPIVATDAPGIRDVIADGQNGLLVPIENPQALAAAIRRVFGDARLCDRMIENGLVCVSQKYNWRIVLEQYRMVLEM